MPRFTRVLDIRNSRTASRTAKKIRDEILRFQRDETEMTRDVERMIERDYLRPMLKELRKAPPRRMYPYDYPIEYVSDKQRRFVHAKLGGNPYKRTRNSAKGWKHRVKSEAGVISLKVWNKQGYTQFVRGTVGFGSSNRSMKRYISPIQPYHETTGWTPAYKIVQKYINEAKEEAQTYAEEWYRKNF